MSNIKFGSGFFAIFCVLSISSYVLLFRHKDVNTEIQPLPSGVYETARLFKALTKLGPDQQVGVEIMYDGKYPMRTENLSFSYTMQHRSLERYTEALAMENKVITKRKNPVKWNGYFKVIAVGEELSKGMTNFMSLAYLLSPGMGQMKLVAPYYKRGHLHDSGVPFDMIYDFEYLNRILSNHGYAILVKNDEYERACKGEMIYYVQDYFAYEKKWGLLTEQVYQELFKKTGSKDWLECGTEQPEKTENKKYTICTKNFNMTKLRETVLKNAKCVVIPRWVDHGLIHWNMGAHRLHVDTIFRLLIKPNIMLREEAKLFIDRFLKRPYVAIHIRSGHIRKPPSTVRRCFKLALEFVKALKSTRNVKTVFLSTDMTEYGSALTVGRENMEDELAAMAGAVTYSANATGKLKVIIKTTVSITDVLLLSQSDHLITLGSGSFHGFVVDRFLMHHIKMDPNTWSLLGICEKTKG